MNKMADYRYFVKWVPTFHCRSTGTIRTTTSNRKQANTDNIFQSGWSAKDIICDGLEEWFRIVGLLLELLGMVESGNVPLECLFADVLTTCKWYKKSTKNFTGQSVQLSSERSFEGSTVSTKQVHVSA
jgi:hypothetical protein